MRRRDLLKLATGAALAVAAAVRAAPPAPAGTLRIAGSSTMAPLVRALADRFGAAQPNLQIAVQVGGSQRGIDDVRSGAADLGMVARALAADERDLLGIAIARDGVAFIVHRDNPVKEMTRAQLQAIFSARAVDWKLFGGSAGPIHVLTREGGRATLDLACNYLDVAPTAIRAQRAIGDNAALIEVVAADVHAIGFASIGATQSAINARRPIRALRLDGVAPTTRELARGSYPILRPLNLVVRARPTGATRAFIDFALSAQAADLIAQHDFVAYRD